MNKDQLLKLTVPKLREEALKIEGITGVHGMSKTELTHVLAKHFGIEIDVKKRKALDTSKVKKGAKVMRQKLEEMRPSATRKQLHIMRKKIKRMKRTTRKAVI